MTPNDILNAYRGALELSRCVLPFKAARAVAGLKRALQTEYETLCDAEAAIAERNGGTRMANSQWTFPDPESKERFDEALGAFMKQEADVELPKADISKYADQLRLSPDAIFALDGIVVFDREG